MMNLGKALFSALNFENSLFSLSPYLTMYLSYRRKTYEAMTTMLDDVLASVVTELKNKNMWNDTLFVFSSDVRPSNCGSRLSSQGAVLETLTWRSQLLFLERRPKRH